MPRGTTAFGSISETDNVAFGGPTVYPKMPVGDEHLQGRKGIALAGQWIEPVRRRSPSAKPTEHAQPATTDVVPARRRISSGFSRAC